MGEARYYAELKFDSDADAIAQIERVENFLKFVEHTADDWQTVRAQGQGGFPALWDRHQAVFIALDIPRDFEVGHSMNGLASELDSPTESPDFEIWVYDCAIRFAGTVWHFANWTRLGEALVRLTKARKFGWVSDEYVEIDYYDYIDYI